jgi:hypothetical protein
MGDSVASVANSPSRKYDFVVQVTALYQGMASGIP